VASKLKPDITEMLVFLKLVAEPDQVIELRLLKVQLPGHRTPVTMSGFFSDHDALANAAAKYCTTSQGTYITLNPINPALLARAKNRVRLAGKDCPLTGDSDVVRRRWLPIDLDPIRPSGISANDQEHSLAIERAKQVRDALRAEGWPDPFLADSGNGGHLLYRIDCRPDDNLVKRCLEALALRFDDENVKIDQAVFNPSRIWKLYGTLSRKGDALLDRPYRLARILEAP
jgi:hypothetical protein